jgi:hypothetical protein
MPPREVQDHDLEPADETKGPQMPRHFDLVVGGGGYHNLHQFASGTEPGEQVADGLTFEFGDDQNWGFVELTIGDGTIAGSYTSVDASGNTTAGADTFTV